MRLRSAVAAIRAFLGLAALAALAFLGYAGYLLFAPSRASTAYLPPQAPVAGFPASERLQQVLDGYSAELGGVGLQATLILPDGRVWTGVAGNANHERGYPLTPDHRLYIGSITKVYTAALVMDLVAQGLITLEDPVTRWVELPQAHGVTVRMLLNHTSGLSSYTEDGWFLLRYFGQPGKRWEPRELLGVVLNRPLNFPPGSRHEYSNTNYLLLGMILEDVTGRPYGLLIRDLAVRLGLEATHTLIYPEQVPVATGYDQSLLRLGRRNMTRFRTSLETGAHAAGAILATSRDVARFVHALITGELLPDMLVAEMQNFVDARGGDVPEEQGYGLGLQQLVVAGEPYVGHRGTIPGYSSVAVHHVEKGYTFVILSNLSVIDELELLKRVQEAVNPLLAAPGVEGSGSPGTSGEGPI
ncbi:MAG TPA: serine hydrolase domain-containing protein [Limnochorda sp.]